MPAIAHHGPPVFVVVELIPVHGLVEPGRQTVAPALGVLAEVGKGRLPAAGQNAVAGFAEGETRSGREARRALRVAQLPARRPAEAQDGLLDAGGQPLDGL